MTRFALPTVVAALALAGCGSDTICPVGFYAVGSACIPVEATDVSEDTAESDLGDSGVIDDTGASDTASDTPEDSPTEDVPTEDTPMEDTPSEDTSPDTPQPDVVPDVPEEDVCTPDCVGFECGSDGCGGICGTCGGDESCIDGLCERDPVPAPRDCADGFECIADCGLSDECVEECGVSSADPALQSEILSAFACAEAECGGDTTGFGWLACAEDSCAAVRTCLGIVTTDGACTNSADTAVLAEVGGDALSGVIGDCTIGCFSGGDPAPCISGCVQDETGLSTGCSDCFGDTGACTLTSCIFDCISPDSPGCATCIQSNCGPAFAECAGLEFPG